MWIGEVAGWLDENFSCVDVWTSCYVAHAGEKLGTLRHIFAMPRYKKLFSRNGHQIFSVCTTEVKRCFKIITVRHVGAWEGRGQRASRRRLTYCLYLNKNISCFKAHWAIVRWDVYWQTFRFARCRIVIVLNYIHWRYRRLLFIITMIM